MKHHIKNLSNIVIVFLLCMGLGFATQNKIVINGIILVFIIHWLLYIPANIFKTEKFYDLTGSLAYISVISYILYSKTQSFGSGIGEIVISLVIIIFLYMFFKVFREKKGIKNKKIISFNKNNLNQWMNMTKKERYNFSKKDSTSYLNKRKDLLDQIRKEYKIISKGDKKKFDS